jgi:hypothetical protein
MTTSQYISKSLLSALGVFAYISLLVAGMANAENIFGADLERTAPFIIPIFMLLVFVISATITGLLVLYKPITLYVDGMKKEAFTLLLSTIGWLVVFLALVGAYMISL